MCGPARRSSVRSGRVTAATSRPWRSSNPPPPEPTRRRISVSSAQDDTIRSLFDGQVAEEQRLFWIGEAEVAVARRIDAGEHRAGGVEVGKPAANEHRCSVVGDTPGHGRSFRQTGEVAARDHAAEACLLAHDLEAADGAADVDRCPGERAVTVRDADLKHPEGSGNGSRRVADVEGVPVDVAAADQRIPDGDAEWTAAR